MKKAIAWLLPAALALAGGCAGHVNKNLPPRTNESSNIRKDLEPYKTPNQGPAAHSATAGMNDEAKPAREAEEVSDRTISDNVRRAIAQDTSLSADAKNVTVKTDDGVVRLSGPVATKHEREVVAEKAMQVAGVIRVENRTDVRH